MNELHLDAVGRPYNPYAEVSLEAPSSVSSRRRFLRAGMAGIMLSSGVKAKNPYVSDGLVAMWDGEWNAGWGIHDANATTWKDLVGDADLRPYRLYQVDEKGMRGLWQESASEASMNTPKNTITGGHWSLSYAMGREVGTRETLAILQYNTGSGLYGFLNYADISIYFCDGTNVSPRYGKTSLSKNNAGCAMHDENGTSVQTKWPYYYGDTLQSSPTGGTSVSIKPVSSGYLGIGNNSKDTWWIHSVRLYNRMLTQAEVAANYAVDKARFGLD